MTEIAWCGLTCHDCDWRGKASCKGCHASAGEMFWGPCEIARCAIDRGLADATCADCEEMPCERLKRFSLDSEHGDGGRRIETLRSIRRED